jgi:hypothetical protein
MDVFQKLRDFFVSKQQAYHQTFVPGNLSADKVLADLAKFCRAHQSTFHPDPRQHAILEGRREVFLRIEKFLQLSPEEIWELYGKADK